VSVACGDDLDLVERYLQGDPHGKEEMTRRLECILKFLRTLNRSSKTLSASDMEDVHQDTWTQVLKSLRSYKGESKLETWVFKISSRVLTRFLHSRNKRVMSMLPAEIPVNDDPAVAETAHGQLEHYLRLLPEQVAAVLRLRFLLSLPFRDISHELDISINTARTYYHRGIDTLREYLPPPA
jgi:RNA polymerase sigma-70 factor, ECF subfamily